jgi:hypothetical protein
MKRKNKIWICTFILMAMVLLLTNSCEKDNGNTNINSSTGWSALGNMDINGVNDLYIDKNGNLFAAGNFTNSNGNYYVAKWDGSKWSEVGSPNLNGSILALCGDSNGNLYIGGSFNKDNYNYVAKWNGSNWTNIGSMNISCGDINVLCADASGNIYMSGLGLYESVAIASVKLILL